MKETCHLESSRYLNDKDVFGNPYKKSYDHLWEETARVHCGDERPRSSRVVWHQNDKDVFGNPYKKSYDHLWEETALVQYGDEMPGSSRVV